MNTAHITNCITPDARDTRPSVQLGDWYADARDPEEPNYWYVVSLIDDKYYLVGVVDGDPHLVDGAESLETLDVSGLVKVKTTNIQITL